MVPLKISWLMHDLGVQAGFGKMKGQNVYLGLNGDYCGNMISPKFKIEYGEHVVCGGDYRQTISGCPPPTAHSSLNCLTEYQLPNVS